MEFDFSQVFIALVLTLLAGFSTAIGASIAFFSNKDNLRTLSMGLGFSAGVMVYVSFMEILPQAFTDLREAHYGITGDFLVLFCFFVGIALCAIVDKLLPEDLNPNEFHDHYEELRCPLVIKIQQNNPSYVVQEPEKKIHTQSLKKAGIFTAVAIAIHNFPEGFATFIASLENISFGIAIAIAIAIHNIPEGMAVSLPIYHATGDKKKAFLYSALSGLSEPLGAIVAAFLLLPFLNELSLAITFAFVSGVMVYISFDELLPAARTYGEAHDCLYGLVAGMAVMAISLVFLN